MFKKIALVAATGMLFAAGQASATITAAGPGPYSITVTGTVSQSVTLTCSKTFPITINSATNQITVQTAGQTFGSGTCGLVTFTSNWLVQATPVAGGLTAGLNVTNVNANSLTGTCTQGASDVISGTWTNPTTSPAAAGRGTASGSTSGLSLGSPKRCTLNVTLTASPDLVIN